MRHRSRSRARRNPSLLGFTLPPTMEIVGVAGGLIVPPMVANYIWNNFVAGTSMATSKWAYLGVEAASVAITGFAVKRFVNQRIGNMVLLGGAARFVIDLIQNLAPTLLPAVATPTGLTGMGSQVFLGNGNGVGYYERSGRGVGYYNQRPMLPNPGLGRYYTGDKTTNMLVGTPDRLDPRGRF